MIFLLDADVCIDANRDYYPIERIPEFWEWLVYMGKSGKIKIPYEIFKEIKDGNDILANWAKDKDVEESLMINKDIDEKVITEVVAHGYAPDLTDVEIIKVGRDPFLIAYAVISPEPCCVVTTENSKRKRERANKHIPDVCGLLGVRCCNTYELIKQLDFSTNWKIKLNP